MPLIEFAIRHNRTEADARARLGEAVEEARRRYGPMIHRVEWSEDKDSVRLIAVGAVADMRVDADRIHAAVDLPIFGALLGGKVANGLKEILQRQLR